MEEVASQVLEWILWLWWIIWKDEGIGRDWQASLCLAMSPTIQRALFMLFLVHAECVRQHNKVAIILDIISLSSFLL